MRKKLLAICDSEPTYAKKLMEQISQDQKSEFHVRTFSDAGQLFQYSKKHEIDLLLMEDCFREEIRYKIPAKKRFLLSRDAANPLQSTMSKSSETVISKYQPAPMILQQLMNAVSVNESMEKKRTSLKKMASKVEKGKLIGVYSPVHRIGKTKFSLELAEKISRNEAVLYLNLEDYSGLDYCVPIQGKEDLGALLYYAKQDSNTFGIRLSMLVSQMDGIDYVPPAQVTRDIREVSSQQWVELLEQIRDKSIYGTIVLDLGESIQGLFEILRLCEIVYTPYIEEKGAKAKLKQYFDNLRRLGYEDVIEHTVQKEMINV